MVNLLKIMCSNNINYRGPRRSKLRLRPCIPKIIAGTIFTLLFLGGAGVLVFLRHTNDGSINMVLDGSDYKLGFYFDDYKHKVEIPQYNKTAELTNIYGETPTLNFKYNQICIKYDINDAKKFVTDVKRYHGYNSYYIYFNELVKTTVKNYLSSVRCVDKSLNGTFNPINLDYITIRQIKNTIPIKV